MMRRPNFAARRARAGKGLLPPNPKQWDNEHNGIDLREELGIPLNAALAPEIAFSLLPNVAVMAHGELPLAQIYVDHFRSKGLRSWSGMGIPLPGGGAMVLFNDAHPPNRVRATLMEEFFHLRLEHPATTVRLYSTKGAYRNYDASVEGEAYNSGAAALVPFATLKQLVADGMSASRIATVLSVSIDLVIFRAKVTKLYGRLRVR